MDPSVLATPRVDRRGLSVLGELLREAGCRRVFVICGSGGRHLPRLQAQLAGVVARVYAEARRHVPEPLVARAGEALGAFGADAVVTFGGGSATGLGKALRLTQRFFFVAVPSTYAGSELTDLYGITSDSGKRTGRDLRVLPDVALYDVELTLDMPLALSAASMINALAHPVSALSTGKLDAAGGERALAAAEVAFGALVGLMREPRDRAARLAAIDATVLTGGVLRVSPVGIHHQLAHAIGGLFDLDHAGLHSVLLPHSLGWLARTAPDTQAALERRLGQPALARRLFELLRGSGAATSLAALGLTREALDGLYRARPELPREVLEPAFAGREPEPS